VLTRKRAGHAKELSESWAMVKNIYRTYNPGCGFSMESLSNPCCSSLDFQVNALTLASAELKLGLHSKVFT